MRQLERQAANLINVSMVPLNHVCTCVKGLLKMFQVEVREDKFGATKFVTRFYSKKFAYI